MLDELAAWVDDIPPYPTAQRFGNLAFREYGKRLEEVLVDRVCSIIRLLTCHYPSSGPKQFSRRCCRLSSMLPYLLFDPTS